MIRNSIVFLFFLTSTHANGQSAQCNSTQSWTNQNDIACRDTTSGCSVVKGKVDAFAANGGGLFDSLNPYGCNIPASMKTCAANRGVWLQEVKTGPCTPMGVGGVRAGGRDWDGCTYSIAVSVSGYCKLPPPPIYPPSNDPCVGKGTARYSIGVASPLTFQACKTAGANACDKVTLCNAGGPPMPQCGGQSGTPAICPAQ